MIATCGLCDWRLEETNPPYFEVVAANSPPAHLVDAAWAHVRVEHPQAWTDWVAANDFLRDLMTNPKYGPAMVGAPAPIDGSGEWP